MNECSGTRQVKKDSEPSPVHIIEVHMESLSCMMWRMQNHLLMSRPGYKRLTGEREEASSILCRYGNEAGVAKLIVGNKSDLGNKRAVEYATAKVHLLLHGWLGICRWPEHSLPGDISKECNECGAGILDNGQTDKGQGRNGIKPLYHRSLRDNYKEQDNQRSRCQRENRLLPRLQVHAVNVMCTGVNVWIYTL